MSTQADRSYRWLFWCLALLGLAADQVSKYGVFAWLDDGYTSYPNSPPTRDIIPNAFKLEVQFTGERDPGEGVVGFLRTLFSDRVPKVNHGALWGLGSGMNTFFAAISLGAALAIVIWSCRPRAARERFLCIALGLILAGTLGNFYDRIVFNGVRDFLHWKWEHGPPPLDDFPVFNVADCCLVIGAGLLLLQALYGHPDTEAAPAQTQTTPAAAPPAESVAEATR
jgi:lipoprotein signal peptidase